MKNSKAVYLFYLLICCIFFTQSLQVKSYLKVNTIEYNKDDTFNLTGPKLACNNGEVLQGFHLKEEGSGSKNNLTNTININYAYKCGQNPAIGTETYMDQTKFSDLNTDIDIYDYPKSTITSLSKHNVMCNEGYGIQNAFIVISEDLGQIAFNYTCVRTYVDKDKCGIMQTNKTSVEEDSVNSGSNYLNQQLIKVNNFQVITGFKIISDMVTKKFPDGNKTIVKTLPYFSYVVNYCNFLEGEKLIQAQRGELWKKDIDFYFNSNTAETDDDEGSILALTKFDVKCNSTQALQGFHLLHKEKLNNNTSNNTKKKYTLKYEYSCINLKMNSINTISIYKDRTNLTEINLTKDNSLYSSTYFLNQLKVKCKNGYALQQFKLINENSKNKNSSSIKIFYSYTCVKANMEKCTNRITSKTDGSSYDGIAKSYYLDRQLVCANENQVFTGFQLNTHFTDNNNIPYPHYTYSYNICSLKSNI